MAWMQMHSSIVLLRVKRKHSLEVLSGLVPTVS
jgi:hypothetical protein